MVLEYQNVAINRPSSNEVETVRWQSSLGLDPNVVANIYLPTYHYETLFRDPEL